MKKEKYPSNERTRQILQDNLKSIREILNWTSADLGDLIGVTKQTISNLETKNSKLTKLHYIAIRTVVVSSKSAAIAGTIIGALIPFVVNGFNKKK